MKKRTCKHTYVSAQPLADLMETQNLSPEALGKLIGRSGTAIRHYVRDKVMPQNVATLVNNYLIMHSKPAVAAKPVAKPVAKLVQEPLPIEAPKALDTILISGSDQDLRAVAWMAKRLGMEVLR